VTDGVSKLDLADLIFVYPRLKVDGIYYCDFLLSQQLLPTISKSLASSYFSNTVLQRTGRASFQTLIFYKIV